VLVFPRQLEACLPEALSPIECHCVCTRLLVERRGSGAAARTRPNIPGNRIGGRSPLPATLSPRPWRFMRERVDCCSSYVNLPPTRWLSAFLASRLLQRAAYCMRWYISDDDLVYEDSALGTSAKKERPTAGSRVVDP